MPKEMIICKTMTKAIPLRSSFSVFVSAAKPKRRKGVKSISLIESMHTPVSR